MATIDERARELGHKFARQYHHNTCFLEHDKSFVYSNDEITDACIEMATDQRKADIDKACEVFDRLMMDYEQDRKSHDECLAEMKRAMMEE